MFIKLFDRQPPTPEYFKYRPNIFDKKYAEFRRLVIQDGKVTNVTNAAKTIEDYDKCYRMLEQCETRHSHRRLLKDAKNFIDKVKKRKERLEQ